MFRSPFKKEPTDNDEAIKQVYARMDTMGPGTPEYTLLVKQLKDLKDIESKCSKMPSSPDTRLIVLGGIAQVLIIVMYENANVLTSKAIGLLLKVKP
jgi:hypothetical protein